MALKLKEIALIFFIGGILAIIIGFLNYIPSIVDPFTGETIPGSVLNLIVLGMGAMISLMSGLILFSK